MKNFKPYFKDAVSFGNTGLVEALAGLKKLRSGFSLEPDKKDLSEKKHKFKAK